MITAENITDEQIRKLQNSANSCTEMACSTCHEVWRLTFVALGTTRHGRSDMVGGDDIDDARARCAEILNARGGK